MNWLSIFAGTTSLVGALLIKLIQYIRRRDGSAETSSQMADKSPGKRIG